MRDWEWGRIELNLWQHGCSSGTVPKMKNNCCRRENGLARRDSIKQSLNKWVYVKFAACAVSGGSEGEFCWGWRALSKTC